LLETRAAYARADVADRLVIHREKATGHVETLAMRAAMLAFLDRSLSR
jgi:hypothetical protein